ncbi:transcriptional regulator [Spirillospora sp. NPDC047279]|uniref:transcriptional regulator n=1 Tax=Spirillospora sp. NPDC047279 TaxID=3155478 RepID=UPI0033F69F3C
MYDSTVRDRALGLLSSGLNISEVSRRTGISRFALREWRLRTEQGRDLYVAGARDCPRCTGSPSGPQPERDYAYLLGQYLGDGCISPVSDPGKGIWALRISCANAWPGVMHECEAAIRAIHPHNKVRLIPREGCTEVNSHSKHWPCLFPQHSPGKKHLRKVELAMWQQTIVARHPERFVRGLLHSDGSRFTNRVRRQLPSGERWYEYPRYNFTNLSLDIQVLFAEALDALEIPWKQMNRTTISVARREGVARLDEFVGPKY